MVVVCDIPKELIIEILLRLPVKSLSRFKSVCKEWHAIITSPSFVKEHFNQDTNVIHHVVIQTNSSFCTYSYFSDETVERLDVPDNLLLWGKFTDFHGPCNGIFCIYITKNRFALWNPTTRKLRLIKCRPSHKFNEVGFGVDPFTGDFKIVLINSWLEITPCFAVYTSSNDSWKYLKQESLRDPTAKVINPVRSKDAYYNGFYYWIKTKKGVAAHPTILAFDMHNEIFTETEIAVQGETIHLINNPLALVSCNPLNPGSRIEIWLMEGKGCWIKSSSVVLPFHYVWVHGFWKRNKILISVYPSDIYKLAVYDLDSQSERQLNIENSNAGSHIFPIFYKESLFSLKDKDGIQDYDTRSAEVLEFVDYEGPHTKLCPMFQILPEDEQEEEEEEDEQEEEEEEDEDEEEEDEEEEEEENEDEE